MSQEAEEKIESKPETGDELWRSLMFWVIGGVGTAVFCFCLVVPSWLEYRAVRRQRKYVKREVARLEKAKQENASLIEAVQEDPDMAERMALQELGYKKPGEHVLRTPARSAQFDPMKKLQPLPPEPEPQWLRYLKMPQIRGGIMLAGGVMVIIAFLAFTPKRETPETEPDRSQ
jgi:hypothetical protein